MVNVKVKVMVKVRLKKTGLSTFALLNLAS